MQTFIFEPKEDITAHELSLILRQFMGQYIYVKSEDAEKMVSESELKRHFIKDE